MPDNKTPDSGGTEQNTEKKSGVEIITPDKATIAGLMHLVHDLHQAVKDTGDNMKSEYGKLSTIVKDIMEGRSQMRESELRSAVSGAHQHFDIAKAGFVFDAKYYLTEPWDTTKGLDSFNKGMVTPSNEVMIKELQQSSDDLYLVSQIMGKTSPSGIKSLKTYRRFRENMERCGKAMSIVAGAAGVDWIPTGFSAELIELVHLQLLVAGLHVRRNFPLKVGDWKRPGTSSDTLAYRSTAANSDSPSKFVASTRSTRNVTFSAEKLAVRTLYAVELDEDAIVELLPQLKLNVVQSISRAIEDTIINGDTGCEAAGTRIDLTDMHGNTPDGESPCRMWDGYRKKVKDQTSSTTTGGATGGSLRDNRAILGKYGVRPSDCALVCSINAYLKGFLKQVTDVTTVDKYGDKATVLSGELAKFDGIPIVVSEQSRDDLNTSGLSGGKSGNADGEIIHVYRPGFELADKRQITIEADKIKGTDQIEVIGTWRGDFQALYTTGQKITAAVINPT